MWLWVVSLKPGPQAAEGDFSVAFETFPELDSLTVLGL